MQTNSNAMNCQFGQIMNQSASNKSIVDKFLEFKPKFDEKAFVEKQMNAKFNPFMNMPNPLNVDINKMKKMEPKKPVEYSMEQVQVSEKVGVLKRGYVLPKTIIPFVKQAMNMKDAPTEGIKKLIFDDVYEEQVSRMEIVLFDRLRGNVKKEGSKLPLGAMRQEVLDEHFGKKHKGERKLAIRRRNCTDGELLEDWSVEVHYTFNDGDEFFSSLKPKKSICQDQLDSFTVIERQELHMYNYLRFKWCVTTGVLYCCWEQESVKRIDGEWVPIV